MRPILKAVRAALNEYRHAAPAPLSREGIRLARPGVGTVTVTELVKAFEAVVDKDGDLLNRFQSTYARRAAIPGLDESKPGVCGLTDVLAELFTLVPPESYFRDWSGIPFKDESFKGELRCALRNVSAEYPRSLWLVEAHAHEQNHSLAELLGALLEFYADNKVGYPF